MFSGPAALLSMYADVCGLRKGRETRFMPSH